MGALWKSSPAYKLVQAYRRNGYMRFPIPARSERESHEEYKKGYEVRFVAADQKELQEIRQLLQEVGFTVSQPFAKAKKFVQPLYGKEAVEWFQTLLDWAAETDNPPPVPRRRQPKKT